MIQDHPDLDGRFMRWCEHENVHEITVITSIFPHRYICEDCDDTMPVNSSEDWPPKLIGTRIG